MIRNLLVTSTYILAMVIAAIVGAILYSSTSLTDNQLNSWVMIIMGLSGALMMIFFFRSYMKKQVADFKHNKGRIIMYGVMGFFMIYVLSIIANIIIYNILGYVDEAQNQTAVESMFYGLSTFEVVMISLSVALFIPILEEMTFRKGLYGLAGQMVFWIYYSVTKKERLPVSELQGTKLFTVATIVAIIVSSLVFGLLHVSAGDYIFLISYGAAGLGLGLVYHMSGRNIFASIITHVIQNSIGVIFILTM